MTSLHFSAWTKRIGFALILALIPFNNLTTTMAADELLKEIIGKDHAPMVSIPEGSFPMGVPKAARDGGVDERPNHEVFVDRFYIDKFEVTNGRYLQFVTELVTELPNIRVIPIKEYGRVI